MYISLRVSATANGAHCDLPTARSVRRSNASGGTRSLQGIYTHMYTYIHVYTMYISLRRVNPPTTTSTTNTTTTTSTS